MEYVYATLTLNETGQEINQRNLTNVLEAAGADVIDSRVKAIVAALEDVDLADLGSEAGIAPAPVVESESDDTYAGTETVDNSLSEVSDQVEDEADESSSSDGPADEARASDDADSGDPSPSEASTPEDEEAQQVVSDGGSTAENRTPDDEEASADEPGDE